MLKHIYNGIVHPQKKIQTLYPHKAVAINSFFGYYDIPQFNAAGELCYLQMGKKDADGVDICVSNMTASSTKVICKTHIWNWQQGCRLRWSKDGKHIYFNDFRNGRLIAVKKSVATGDETVYSEPLYDIDPDEKRAISLDFLRLGYMRPGYGYVVGEYSLPKSDELLQNGIKIFDMQQDEVSRVISYSTIIDQCANDLQVQNIANCYINHLSFAPDGNHFLFFWLEKMPNGIHKASLCVFDMRSNKITALETDLSVSHYDWCDNNKIVVTAYDAQRKCRYYIYDIISGERQPFLHELLTEDGHPTWLSDGNMITDTYPDKLGFERLIEVDCTNKAAKDLFKVYHSYKVTGEKRCDLHPRVSPDERAITIDVNTSGNRDLIIIWRKK